MAPFYFLKGYLIKLRTVIHPYTWVNAFAVGLHVESSTEKLEPVAYWSDSASSNPWTSGMSSCSSKALTLSRAAWTISG